MAHSQKPRDTCLIICHKEVPLAVLAKSRTRTPDHLLVSNIYNFKTYFYKVLKRCTLTSVTPFFFYSASSLLAFYYSSSGQKYFALLYGNWGARNAPKLFWEKVACHDTRVRKVHRRAISFYPRNSLFILVYFLFRRWRRQWRHARSLFIRLHVGPCVLEKCRVPYNYDLHSRERGSGSETKRQRENNFWTTDRERASR